MFAAFFWIWSHNVMMFFWCMSYIFLWDMATKCGSMFINLGCTWWFRTNYMYSWGNSKWGIYQRVNPPIGAFPPQGLRGCHSEARWPRRAKRIWSSNVIPNYDLWILITGDQKIPWIPMKPHEFMTIKKKIENTLPKLWPWHTLLDTPWRRKEMPWPNPRLTICFGDPVIQAVAMKPLRKDVRKRWRWCKGWKMLEDIGDKK